MLEDRYRSHFTYVMVAVLLIASSWGASFWTVGQEREKTLAEHAAQAQRLAMFFERNTLAILRYSDAYLKAVRKEYVKGYSVDAVRRLMADIPLDHTLVSHITIIDDTGAPRLVSGHTIKPGTSAADRPYFRFHQTSSDDAAYVSLPHRGRNSGKLIVRLVRRYDRPDGSFGGVVFAAIEAAAITEFFSAMNLGPNSSATLVGTDKRIRARSTYGRLGPGQDISGSRIWRELERSPTGLYEQTSVVDGVTRYYAYRLLFEFPLIVAIGVAIEDVSLAVTPFKYSTVLVATLITIVIVVMTVFLFREVHSREKLVLSEARLEERVKQRTAELEAVQDELLKKQRLAVLGELTGTVAHELRNPLSAISTDAVIMQRKFARAQFDFTTSLSRMRRNITRCNKIITELLDFARARGPDLQPTKLDEWLQEILREEDFHRETKSHLTLAAPGVVVNIDHDGLRRAMVNLLDNARDALADAEGEGGEIRISTRQRNGRVEIEVADNGPGLSPETLDKIHEPLFSTKTFGVGLGVPIVDRVMADHGGGLDITSTPGEGTRATLWMPVQRHA